MTFSLVVRGCLLISMALAPAYAFAAAPSVPNRQATNGAQLTTGMNAPRFFQALGLPKPVHEVEFIDDGLLYRFRPPQHAKAGPLQMTLSVFPNCALAHVAFLADKNPPPVAQILNPNVYSEHWPRRVAGVGDEFGGGIQALKRPNGRDALGQFVLRRGNVVIDVIWQGHTASAASFARKIDDLLKDNTPVCPKAGAINPPAIIVQRLAGHPSGLSFRTGNGSRVLPLGANLSQAAAYGKIHFDPDPYTKTLEFCTPEGLVVSVPRPADPSKEADTPPNLRR